MSVLSGVMQGILIGGGSILSLLTPSSNGGTITSGQAIGAGAVALGGLINKGASPTTTIDRVTGTINNTLMNAGLMSPAIFPSANITNTSGPAISAGTVAFSLASFLPIIIVGGGLFFLLSKRRKR